MPEVTREMISAAHGVTMKSGVVLSWEILRDIYLSMDRLANHEKTSGSPLTDEEIRALPQWFPSHEAAAVIPLIRAVEAKHGITDPQVEDRLARHGIPMPDDDNPSF